MKATKESLIANALAGLFAILTLVAVFFMIRAWRSGHFQSVSALRLYLESFGMWGPLVLTLIQALQVVLPVLPGWLGCIVGAALFGASGGFWINYIGISAGSLAAYWLARLYGIALIKKMLSIEKYERLTDWVNRRKSYAVILFMAILLPLAPDDYLCYFSGLSSMSFRKFSAIILVAKPWCILFYSLLFARML